MKSFWVGSEPRGASGSGKIGVEVSSLERCFFFFFSERERSTSDMALGSVSGCESVWFLLGF